MGREYTRHRYLTSRESRVFHHLSFWISSITGICGTKILQPLEGVNSKFNVHWRERERENAPRDGKAKREKRFIHAVFMKISKYGKVVCTETCRLMYEGNKF
jgi:hypothetical protein